MSMGKDIDRIDFPFIILEPIFVRRKDIIFFYVSIFSLFINKKRPVFSSRSQSFLN
jgi:hypothetical protein